MTKAELKLRIIRLRTTLEFAIEMQQSVEDRRPHYEGSPANTVAWMELAHDVLE